MKIFLVSFLILCFLGCSPGKEISHEQTFIFNNGAEPETLDPALMTGFPEHTIAMALFEGAMEKRIIRAKVNFVQEGSTSARIIIGYDPASGGYYSVWIGGYKIAYLIDRFDRHIGWRAIYFKGDRNLITRDKTYQLEVEFDKQTINLRINNVEIFRYSIPIQNIGNQVGLFSWGRGNVTFSDIELISK